MKKNTLSMLLITAATMAFTPLAANAKGCIKGAVVGGAAGHVAGGHGTLGAAAGCLTGRHMAKKKEEQQQQSSQGAPQQGGQTNREAAGNSSKQ